MSIIDIILLIIVGYFIITGYLKGFSRSIFSFLAIVLSIVAAIVFYEALGGMIDKLLLRINPEYSFPTLVNTLSFIIIFILVNYGINKIGVLLEDTLEKLYLRWLNKTGGGVIGFIKAFILINVLLMLILLLDFEYINNQIATSKIAPYNFKLWNYVLSLFPDNYVEQFAIKINEYLNKITLLN